MFVRAHYYLYYIYSLPSSGNIIKVNKHNISNTTTFKIFYNRIESFGKTWNNKELRIDRMTRKRIEIKMTKEITK